MPDIQMAACSVDDHFNTVRPQSSVWGSGLAGAICAAAALATGDPSLWRLGFVASFVSKLSDTVSSEIGKVCRCCRHTYQHRFKTMDVRCRRMGAPPIW